MVVIDEGRAYSYSLWPDPLWKDLPTRKTRIQFYSIGKSWWLDKVIQFLHVQRASRVITYTKKRLHNVIVLWYFHLDHFPQRPAGQAVITRKWLSEP